MRDTPLNASFTLIIRPVIIGLSFKKHLILIVALWPPIHTQNGKPSFVTTESVMCGARQVLLKWSATMHVTTFQNLIARLQYTETIPSHEDVLNSPDMLDNVLNKVVT